MARGSKDTTDLGAKQLNADKDQLRTIWEKLLRSQEVIRQGQEAFVTSKELLERLKKI